MTSFLCSRSEDRASQPNLGVSKHPCLLTVDLSEFQLLGVLSLISLRLSSGGLNSIKVNLMFSAKIRSLLTLAFSFYGSTLVVSSAFPSVTGFAFFAASVILTPFVFIVGIIVSSAIILLAMVGIVYFKSLFSKNNGELA